MHISTEVHGIDIETLRYFLNGTRDNLHNIDDPEMVIAIQFLRSIGMKIMTNYNEGRYSETERLDTESHDESTQKAIIEKHVIEEIHEKLDVIDRSALMQLATPEEKEAIDYVVAIVRHSLNVKHTMDTVGEEDNDKLTIYETEYYLPTESGRSMRCSSYIVARNVEELEQYIYDRKLNDIVTEEVEDRVSTLYPKVSEIMKLNNAAIIKWAVNLGYIYQSRHDLLPEKSDVLWGPDGYIVNIIQYIEDYNSSKITYHTMLMKCTPIFETLMKECRMYIPEDYD